VLEFIVAIDDVTILIGLYIEDLQGLNLNKILKLACPKALKGFWLRDLILTSASTSVTSKNSITVTLKLLSPFGLLIHHYVSHGCGHLCHHTHSLLHHRHSLLHHYFLFASKISSGIKYFLIHFSLASKEPFVDQLRSVKSIPKLTLRMCSVKHITEFVT
jgi:hypothetical protein